MDERAWLVNVARGRHVHTDALVAALREGSIAGAGLDVTDPEPLPDGHPLWSAANCIITPAHRRHLGDGGCRCWPAGSEANVAHFAAGEPLEGVVDPDGRLLNGCRRRGCGVPASAAGCGPGPSRVAVRLRRPVRPAGAGRPTRVARAGPWSLWRYRSVLPAGGSWERVSLGEGMTPLVPVRPGLWCKLEYVSPTGSFKDRGAAVMISVAAGLGVERVVADSSGNAGTAVAAYAGRAGMAAEVFVPESTPAGPGGRHRGVRRPGGRRGRRPGGGRGGSPAPRWNATGAWYASHVYRPAFVHGVKTLAFELWEQLDGRTGDGRGAGRQRHAGPGAVAGLP